MTREIAEDLQCIARQEQLLQFPSFDHASAWDLGQRLKLACEAAQVATTIEVRLNRRTVFLYAMPGTAPANAHWARRKRNVVEMMDQSSYAVGLAGQEEGISMELAMGLPAADYASHGGAFPLRVRGVGCIGVVTVSGLPSREDHSLLVQVLAQMCGVDPAQVALPMD
ncbi:heme-degrading domain-containing protein [Pseudomonas sp. HR96]|uniref:heme-degrading domain-containing protein n=1 Tax=Pseudomonas sp. HR96 TaxID=1027966 RepID=UPI002A7635CE|nr:heme-degrading domain-containing protein [Pseudomonas sp. HR96]WPP01942.1 heme-degrading domain-containing protein [Pseudomonas sp. HR96]